MMRSRHILAALFILGAMIFNVGFGGRAPSSNVAPRETQPGELVFPTEFPIDNYEDGETKSNPEWWSFGNLTLTVVPTNRLVEGEESIRATVGEKALNLRGEASDWYVGGLGTYLAREKVELSLLKKIELDVYGIGGTTANIKFELIDDDNGNYKVENDDKWIPTLDDRWIFELPVDWKGWKHISIQFSEFKVDNPGRGDGIWNVEQVDGSGGLLQLQIIITARGKMGAVNPTLDNLQLIQ